MQNLEQHSPMSPTLPNTPLAFAESTGDAQHAVMSTEKKRRDRFVRIRASIACRACRDKKVKCSGKGPCGHCIKRGLECVFPTDSRRKVQLLPNRPLHKSQEALSPMTASGDDMLLSPAESMDGQDHASHFANSRSKSRQSGLPRGRPKVTVQPCRFCGKTFKRVEHLSRHERIHTQEKPFGCSCGHSFSRQDLLARHKRIAHDEYPNKKRRESKDSSISHQRQSLTPPSSESGHSTYTVDLPIDPAMDEQSTPDSLSLSSSASEYLQSPEAVPEFPYYDNWTPFATGTEMMGGPAPSVAMPIMYDFGVWDKPDVMGAYPPVQLFDPCMDMTPVNCGV